MKLININLIITTKQFFDAPGENCTNRLSLWVMKKFIHQHIRTLIAAGVIITILVVSALIPQIQGDGTNKYTGAKLKAADIILDSFDPFDEGVGTIPGISKLRVREVTYTPRGSLPACKDPNNPYAYTVSLEVVWWFGITTPAKTDSVCRLFGG